MIDYRTLTAEEISLALFEHFRRRQTVTKCWRKSAGKWRVEDVSFIDDWTEEEYELLVSCLQNTLRTGGMVTGAISNGRLKGFVSVEGERFGSGGEYLDLSALHVSEELRGKGIGKALFGRAKMWAKERGGKKLYISAHSAVESQAFYRAMGCAEAKEYCAAHVEKEPCDCQLECVL